MGISAPGIAAPRCSINLAGIDFVSVRLVVLCADLGSLSAAARRAHLSLSSASHRLSHLEDFFGARLFERDYRGLHATEAGTVFVAHGRDILLALDGLGASLASISGRQREYRATASVC